MSTGIAVDATVDARNQSCPMPVVLARKGMNGLDSGQVLALEATDPGSCGDIPSWARDMGHELLEQTEAAGVYRYVIRKG
jgi:tRNA 2-thiouridine synthesizing protein A